MRIETTPTPHDGSIPRSKVEAGQAFALAPTPNGDNGVLMVAVFNADPQRTHLVGPGGCCPSVNLGTGALRWINGSTAVWLQDAAVVVQVKK